MWHSLELIEYERTGEQHITSYIYWYEILQRTVYDREILRFFPYSFLSMFNPNTEKYVSENSKYGHFLRSVNEFQ